MSEFPSDSYTVNVIEKAVVGAHSHHMLKCRVDFRDEEVERGGAMIAEALPCGGPGLRVPPAVVELQEYVCIPSTNFGDVPFVIEGVVSSDPQRGCRDKGTERRPIAVGEPEHADRG